MSHRRLVAVVVVALCAAGCGSFTTPSQQRAAEQNQVPTGTSTVAPAGAATSPTPNTTPSAGNGGATDVGVTGDSITVGVVSSISGPVPGLFKGAASGVQAYFAYINSKGGIDGRQLKADVADDQLQCSLNESETASQIKSDFAEVGGFSLYDNCGAIPLKAAPNVPDVHQALSGERSDLPNNFSVEPLQPGASSGPFQFYKSQYGDAYLHAAGLFSNVPSSVQEWNYASGVMKSLGYKIAVADGISALETNLTSQVIQMRSKGVKFVDIFGAPSTFAQFMQAAQQQNWHPIVTTPGSGYDSSVAKIGGNAVNGMLTQTPTSLYFNASDAKNIPAVALFQAWMKKAEPSQVLDLYSVYGWSEAQLFVQALRTVGPDVTRAKVITALKGVTHFSNDLMAPAGPGNKTPAHCYVLTKLINGQWIRLDTPPSKFRCDGAWVNPS